MKKLEGIHLYINIRNFDDVIKDEEEKTGNVTHAIHALDTYFYSIESYGKQHYHNTLTIEKITGARLHMYVVDAVDSGYSAVKDVSAFAHRLAIFVNRDIPKYKTLLDFQIQIGAAYGKFYDFEFTTKEDFSELTTIGHAANYAAKLQALTLPGGISISKSIYDSLPADEKAGYAQKRDESIKKYGQESYYTILLSKMKLHSTITDAELEKVKDYANKVNLNDIEYSGVRKPLDFTNLSKTQCKKIDGIPVFADVRGFTSRFKEDDSNLEEMAAKTQNVLNTMYEITVNHKGVHVQFQGDRELSLYHNIPEAIIEGGQRIPATTCYKSAVLAAMRMIDAVKEHTVHIGVGEDFGRLFATKIGARGAKDNILLGTTVITADQMEDKQAGENQLAITKELYAGLEAEDVTLARQFKLTPAGHYITTVGFNEYKNKLAFANQKSATDRSNYNAAWGDLL